ncbi:MAG: hypothetical protein J6Q54_08820 [Oscillospiraceae bacterium]|nr:hypothetical protein [Oscillospiraceae bacterium]
MNGKVWETHLGMFLKAHYCARCGAKLEREQYHWIVTPNDPDYYHYHSPGRFPRRDYDVYGHHYKCPDCGTKTTYGEQCALAKEQKKQGSVQLTASRIEEILEAHRGTLPRKNFAYRIFYTCLGATVLLIILFTGNDMSTKEMLTVGAVVAIGALASIIMTIVKHRKDS